MYCGGVNTGRVACGAKPASISRALAVAKFGGMRLRGTLRCRSRSQLAVRRWRRGRASAMDGKESKVAMLVAVQSKALEVRFRAETHYREELERRQSG